MGAAPSPGPEAPGARSGGHILYFDHLRLFAMLSVIFMHAASGILRGPMGPGWIADDLLTSLAFTAVPLFFMMSGSLLLQSPRTPDLNYLWRRRLPRLLVPLAFWTLVTVLWLWYRQGMTTREALGLLGGALQTPAYVHLWYIYTLAALYVLSPLLYRMVHGLDERGERYLLGLMACVVALDLLRPLLPPSIRHHAVLDLANKLKLLDGHVFAFLLGFYLSRWEKRIPAWKLVVLALLCWGVISLGTWVESRRVGEYSTLFQQQNGGWELLLATLLFLLAKELRNRPLKTVLARSLVELSLPIYLMHGLVMNVLWFFDLYPRRFATQVLIWGLITLICLAAAWILARIPGLRWLATGKGAGPRILRASDRDVS